MAGRMELESALLARGAVEMTLLSMVGVDMSINEYKKQRFSQNVNLWKEN